MLSALVLGLLSLLSTGCLSPIALHQAVLEYDRAVGRSKPKCCCSTSPGRGIFPTFYGRVQRGGDVRIPGERRPDPYVRLAGAGLLGLSFGGSMAERPTMTIVPIQGEEFTSRILTPFDESRVTFMFQQGSNPRSFSA